MWNSRPVQLNVRLPNDIAAQAEEVQETDPDFLSRIILYGLTRRSIYNHLRDSDELESVRSSLDNEADFIQAEAGAN